MRSFCVLWVLSSITLGTPVAAEPYPPEVTLDDRAPQSERGRPWLARPFALELHTSLGGPYGAIGAALDYTTGPSFALAAGFGLHPVPLGPHWGAMGRIRPLIIHGFASGFEAGLSASPHEAPEQCGRAQCEEWSWELAVWGHIALFAELRAESGISVRASGGVSSVFNVEDGRCEHCGPGATPSLAATTLPYAGLAVGWAPEL